MHPEKILILDFGSQYTQLIARRVRELNVYSEIIPYNKAGVLDDSIKGVILSGSPFSVTWENALLPDLSGIIGKVPVLGVCYGAQLVAHQFGGQVSPSKIREYGKANLENVLPNDALFEGIGNGSQVWMSHSDTVTRIPEGFELLAQTGTIPVAAFRSAAGRFEKSVHCIQFHPEVTHSLDGPRLLQNFVLNICGCAQTWTPESFIESTVRELQELVGEDQVLMALSGGVDSTVAAALLHRAVGSRLHCFFIDNGLLRKDEFQDVLASYEGMGLSIKGIDARHRFWDALKGVSDPERKRKIIGGMFVEIFQEEAKAMHEVRWLGQGTIYPDVIESMSVHGPSVTIKSHHNVGGLPEKLHLKLAEPLRMLFKDEVRRVGKTLGITDFILKRHPFPGPGLGIRILGEVTPEKVAMLQEAEAIYSRLLRESGWYDQVWQAGAILLPVQSVGVMGDERTYEFTLALRAVNSTDGMTAEWSRLPYELLGSISNEIINSVKGINRVVYDISTKPPATIEWE